MATQLGAAASLCRPSLHYPEVRTSSRSALAVNRGTKFTNDSVARGSLAPSEELRGSFRQRRALDIDLLLITSGLPANANHVNSAV